MEVIICDWDENKDFTIEVKGNTKVTKTFSEKEGKTYVKFEKEKNQFVPKEGDIICVTALANTYIRRFRKYENGNLTYYGDIRIRGDRIEQSIGNLCSVDHIRNIRLANDSERLKYYEEYDNMLSDAQMINDKLKSKSIPKKGDLCIFWDEEKKEAFIDVLNEVNDISYLTYDGYWMNCVKYVSEEQYRKIKSGK